jgi:O-antigen/teichoic acid export membrane protein
LGAAGVGPELTAGTEAPTVAQQPPWDRASVGFDNRESLRARLTTSLTAGYHASVVRRLVVLATFVGPAFLANLLVYYFTARILSPENFGLFYVAVTTGYVAFSGSLVLNIFFTRYLVRVGGAVSAARRIQRLVGFWGALISFAVFVLLLAASRYLGPQSPLIVLLIVVDTYLSYLADFGRAFLQSRHETWRLGSYTLAWTILRLLLCVLGAAVFGTVWAALLGSAVAAAAIFVGLQFLMARAETRDRTAAAEHAEAPKLPAFHTLLPVAFGYGLSMAISNLDILLIYFLLKNQDIGIYSASSVLPKGILAVTVPLSQMLFAVMIGDHESDQVFRVVIRKTISSIGLMTGAASLGIWLFTPWLCGGSFGLKLCAPAPLHLLLPSAVALSLLRISVLLEFVRQRDWLILSLFVPAAAYLLFAWYSKPAIDMLALQFTVFSVAALAFFTIVQWAAAAWQGSARAG